jgi:hypothetical protein
MVEDYKLRIFTKGTNVPNGGFIYYKRYQRTKRRFYNNIIVEVLTSEENIYISFAVIKR